MSPATKDDRLSEVPGLVLNKVELPGFVVCEMNVYPPTMLSGDRPRGQSDADSLSGSQAVDSSSSPGKVSTPSQGLDPRRNAFPTSPVQQRARKRVLPFHLQCIELVQPRRSDSILVEVLTKGEVGEIGRAAMGKQWENETPPASTSKTPADSPSRMDSGHDALNGGSDLFLSPNVVPSLCRAVRSHSRLAGAGAVEHALSSEGYARRSGVKELAKAITGPGMSDEERKEKQLLERVLSQAEVLQCRRLATSTLVTFARQLQQLHDQASATNKLQGCTSCVGGGPAVHPPKPLRRMRKSLELLYASTTSASDPDSTPSGQGHAPTIKPSFTTVVALPIPAWLWVIRQRPRRKLLSSQADAAGLGQEDPLGETKGTSRRRSSRRNLHAEAMTPPDLAESDMEMFELAVNNTQSSDVAG